MEKLADDHQMILASDVSEMIEQLQDDLKQDEKHHPDDQKGERYADKEQKAERLRYSGRGY